MLPQKVTPVLPRISSDDIGPFCTAKTGKIRARVRFFEPCCTILDGEVVEPSGIEPLTSCMPCRRSPS